MKFATIALAAATVQGADQAARENTLWYVDGIKGYHEGFYKAFYKSSNHEENNKCLDDETIDSITE